MAGLPSFGAVIWFLPPFGNSPALADLLREQGYREIVAPAEFYVPGTINTIEVRSDGKIALHPTCTIDAALLATMTLQSRTIDRTWAQRLDKKFDVSGDCRSSFRSGSAAARSRSSACRSRTPAFCTSPTRTYGGFSGGVKDTCREAIEWNINSGGRVCQTRSALRADFVYDISYQDGISVQEKGQLTADVAATLKVEADQDRADRMFGTGLIYGVKLMPAGIVLNSPNAKPVDCGAGI